MHSSDSSDEDMSSDEEDGHKQKLTLRIKTETLTGKSTVQPLSKLLKSKQPPSLCKVLTCIYRTLVTKTDQGRLVCELFRKRPSAKVSICLIYSFKSVMKCFKTIPVRD